MTGLLCLDTGSDLVELLQEPRIIASVPYTSVTPLPSPLSREEIPLELLTRKQAEAMRGLGEIANLPPNWDTYGSPPPTAIAIEKVIDILLKIDDRNLPSAHVVPLSGGGVQLEWRVVDRELHLEIGPDGIAQYLQIENGQPFREEEMPSFTIDDAKSLLSWLIPKFSARRAA